MLLIKLPILHLTQNPRDAFERRITHVQIQQIQHVSPFLTHIAVLVHFEIVTLVVSQDGRDEEVHLQPCQVVRADGRVPARGVHAQRLLHARRDAIHVIGVHVLLLHLGLGHEVPDDDQPIPVTSDHHVFQAVAELQPADFVLVPREDVA